MISIVYVVCESVSSALIESLLHKSRLHDFLVAPCSLDLSIWHFLTSFGAIAGCNDYRQKVPQLVQSRLGHVGGILQTRAFYPTMEPAFLNKTDFTMPYRVIRRILSPSLGQLPRPSQLLVVTYSS